MIEAAGVRVELLLVAFLVAGIDLGLAFLMRGEREASREGGNQ